MRENPMKRFFSLLLAVVLLLCFLPAGIIEAQAASTLTLAELREKFPHGYYWNHADNPGADQNNQDGYSSTPCPRHGNIGTATQTCNGFAPNGRQLSWQCMGYAEKLGYDATGYNPRNDEGGWHTYTSVTALDDLKPGDIVRYDTHSIYVTGVSGETVTFTDCNYSARCYIRWDATISMSKLRSSFQYVRSAPFSMTEEPVDCGCSTQYAGTYKCTTVTSYLNIRSGHGTGYSIAGSIPPGGIVTVTEASGTANSDWAHVSYNGITGYASMQYLQKQEEPEHSLFDIPGVNMSLGNSLAVYFYVPAGNITGGGYAEITGANTVVTVPFADCLKQTIDGVEYFLVPFYGIAAKEMTEELTCVAYNGEGTAISNPKTTSVETYALKQLETTTDARLRTVLVDMLNYGAAAQEQFQYNTAAPANARLTDGQKGCATGSIDISALNAAAVKGNGWKGSSLVLESNIQLTVFFDNTVVTKDMTARISYTDHYGKAVSYDIPGSAFGTFDASTLYVSVETLAAADLETVVSIDIMSGDTLVSHNECSMARYCTQAATDPMVIALAKYCQAANSYFHP